MRFAAIALVLPVFFCGCTTVQPGPKDKAPSFQTALPDGQKATLDSLMGEKGLVLYFYPKDETPGCIKQACKFRDELASFQKNGYQVVGVSEDIGGSHQAFQKNRNLNFVLLADNDRSLAKLYNVPIETDPNGTTGFKRTTFVIAKDGVIRRRFEIADPEAQVSEALKATSEPF
jgi:thioredoxin-dependent peroxiredoxin